MNMNEAILDETHHILVKRADDVELHVVARIYDISDAFDEDDEDDQYAMTEGSWLIEYEQRDTDGSVDWILDNEQYHSYEEAEKGLLVSIDYLTQTYSEATITMSTGIK